MMTIETFSATVAGGMPVEVDAHLDHVSHEWEVGAVYFPGGRSRVPASLEARIDQDALHQDMLEAVGGWS